MTHPLLELQGADTAADQLRHRRSHLPEAALVDDASGRLRQWDAAVGAIRDRLGRLEAGIDDAESRTRDLDTRKARLQAQLKTVIAPREAEALQHQIATIDHERSELDDVGLAALDEQAGLDDELTALLGQEAALRTALQEAEEAAAAAGASIDAELADLASRLDGLRAAVEPDHLRRYDRRRSLERVAVSALVGARCGGCHLDLSVAELGEVRSAAGSTDGVTDCPQCGRLLVV